MPGDPQGVRPSSVHVFYGNRAADPAEPDMTALAARLVELEARLQALIDAHEAARDAP